MTVLSHAQRAPVAQLTEVLQGYSRQIQRVCVHCKVLARTRRVLRLMSLCVCDV